MPLPALAALAPGLIAGAASAIGQHQANKQQRALARRQMAFQEYMSSTSWQRGVQDMRAAGINPMLAIHQGGAPGASGAMAQVHDVIGKGVSSAVAATRLRNETKLIGAQAEEVKARTVETKARAEGQAIANTINSYGTWVDPPSDAGHGTTGPIITNQRGQMFVPYGAISNRKQYEQQMLGILMSMAQLPAARVRGSKLAAWIDIGLRSLTGAAAVAGGAGMLRRGFKPGPQSQTLIFPKGQKP